MGVPKFFRYISERYPCLSEFVKEYQIPEFDNLYLDMNGIIHMCSHPDDNNPHFRITEEKLFADIFHYIEVLFRMVKPLKVFFLAIDGVAPRAKMNQQRGRRFRSAKDAEKSELEAKKKGEKLPEAARFDSNCITPGTEFMAKLHEQLKYFVVNKVSSNKAWRNCKVILSGHETPGEGEHKIMDYIRFIRAQPGYDPNTRHCLYGLDADLIMLGLCTHDPHFSLLREEVKFGKKSTKRNNVPEEIRFYLLHLSLMREYLELEFQSLKPALESHTVKFDIEKIIDDWILMSFLVGNDFIPNLPNLHIADGALPVLYEAYKKVLPLLDGYINEAGVLNLQRFEKLMTELGNIDVENFNDIKDDLLYMEAKTGRKQTAHLRVSTQGAGEKPMDPGLAALIERTDEIDCWEGDSSSSDEDSAFKTFKDEYYRNKLEYQNVTPDVMREQAEVYVRAIQWNLNYYYNGVCSWSWYYPHHYSPYISDIKGFANFKIDFDLGQPFRPYEQLLAVLPSASKELLPTCYHPLMSDDNSKIKEYYPENFETDLNGKKQEWEAVVLVPFIDELKLLEAMKPCNELLTPEEVKRNTPGPMLVYTHVEENLGPYEAPKYFPTIGENHALCTPVFNEDIRVPREKLVKGAYPGAMFDVFFPGFPTMKHLEYKGDLRKARVKVFEQPSRYPSMILNILPNEVYLGDTLPVDLLGKNVWVGWPHLVEAQVVAVSNKEEKYKVSSEKGEKFEKRKGETDTFNQEVEGISQHSLERLGIEFGQTEVLVHVKVMMGRKYIFTSNGRVSLDKQFASATSNYPIQSIVTNIKVHDECHTLFRAVGDVFTVGSTCFALTNPFYGSLGTILESADSLKHNQLKVSLEVVEEPDFTEMRELAEKIARECYDGRSAASQLSLSSYVFSRVTGSLFIERNSEANSKSVNIGLDLKFNKKNQETPGYTRKVDNVWKYTHRAIKLVGEYVDQFPEVFEYLSGSRDDDLNADKVFGEEKSDEKVRAIQTWLKSLPTHNIERQVCGSAVLDPEVVAQVEKLVDVFRANTQKKTMVMQIKPNFLYKPELQMGNLSPDKSVKTRVFDRVVNIRDNFTVPLGLKGTVIALYRPSNAIADEAEMYDIVFDEPFAGAMSLNCSENRGFRLSQLSFINLTHGKRGMEKRTGVPGALMARAREQQSTNSFVANNNPWRQQNSAFASFNKGEPPAQKHVPNNGAVYHNSQQPKPKVAVLRRPDVAKNPIQLRPEGGQGFTNKENANVKSVTPVHNGSTIAMGQDNRSAVHKANEADETANFLKKLLKIDDEPVDAKNVQPIFSPPKQIIPLPQIPQIPASASAVVRLLSYFQSNSLGCPRYMYCESHNGIIAQVALPNGKIIFGNEAKTREEASELVARDAIGILSNRSQLNQAPPAGFPIPPIKWVQPNNQQNFTNRPPYQQGQRQHYPSKAFYNAADQKRAHNSPQRRTGGGANAPPFVPLQAVKKMQNKGANKDASSSSQGDGNKGDQQRADNARGDNSGPRQKRQGSGQQRKTRIAANFVPKN